MKSKLQIYTSYVSELNLKQIIDSSYLPIFIIGSLKNDKLIGKYNNTAVHFRNLAPSYDLLHQYLNKKIDLENFEKGYIIEMSNINLLDIIKKFDYLAKISNSKGIVLLSYGSKYENNYRSLLSDLLNESGGLEKKVKELVL